MNWRRKADLVWCSEMDDSIRLHLGCGATYKPGFINMDMYDFRVADVVGDAGRLPFARRSADAIEAFHVLEHFDRLGSIYALAEWYRVLRNGGALVLETPDLLGTMNEFNDADTKSQSRMLNWIYGVDSPGMAHKTGFTYGIAEGLLKECGFCKVRRGEPKTHLYERGMRIECMKPEDINVRAEFLSSFRLHLRRRLYEFDSFALLPLEKHLGRIMAPLPASEAPKKNDVTTIISRAAVVNPKVGIAALDAIRDTFAEDIDGADATEHELERWVQEGLHEKAFTLWCNGSRGTPVDVEFSKFVSTIESDISKELRRERAGRGGVSYLHALDRLEIPILDLELMLLQADAWLQLGIKEFHRAHLDEARRWLELAARANPEDPIASWNLARLKLARGRHIRESAALYDDAVKRAKDRSLRQRISKEAEAVRNGHLTKIPACPVWE